jgi:hypothetical protein
MSEGRGGVCKLPVTHVRMKHVDSFGTHQLDEPDQRQRPSPSRLLVQTPWDHARLLEQRPHLVIGRHVGDRDLNVTTIGVLGEEQHELLSAAYLEVGKYMKNLHGLFRWSMPLGRMVPYDRLESCYGQPHLTGWLPADQEEVEVARAGLVQQVGDYRMRNVRRTPELPTADI